MNVVRSLGAGWILTAALGVLLGSACAGSGGGGAPSCPDDYPSSCPGAGAGADGASPSGPTFTQVNAIIQDRCNPCHAPGGQEAVRPFQTYDQIYGDITTVLLNLRRCIMPPVTSPQLTADERAVLLAWIACGAMND